MKKLAVRRGRKSRLGCDSFINQFRCGYLRLSALHQDPIDCHDLCHGHLCFDTVFGDALRQVGEEPALPIVEAFGLQCVRDGRLDACQLGTNADLQEVRFGLVGVIGSAGFVGVGGGWRENADSRVAQGGARQQLQLLLARSSAPDPGCGCSRVHDC